jgi:uncharacterized protein (TIGR00251 family)
VNWYHWDQRELTLHLWVQPKASRDAFIGPYGENAYKVTITSPPAEGKANRHLLKFLAKAFDIPVSRVELLNGEGSRNKTVRLKSPRTLPIALED